MVFASAQSLLAQQGSPMVVVSMTEITTLIEEVPLSGTVVSPRSAKLSTEVSGIVETMVVDIGDQVKTGDEILQLNSELDTLSLAAASAVTEQAIQKLADAKRRLTNAKTLTRSQSVSANEIESLAAEVRVDSAGVKHFQAEQQRQAAQLRRKKITAPFSGVISRKLVEQGEWVKPGEPVVELVATTGLRIDFQVPQSVYTRLDQATNVRIKLDALPGQTFDGAIETIVPVTDPTTRTFLIRAVLNEQEVELAPGMSASAILQMKSATQGVVVHRDALTRYPDGRITVWVVNREASQTRVSERQVQTGLSFNGKVSITRGLSSNVEVVVQGNEALRDGQSVIVKRTE